MRLVLVHARMELLQLVRMPAFSVPMLTFPSLLMVLFGFTSTHAPRQALMVTFAGFAVLAIAFFQFGVTIAIERSTSWSTFMRTLPLDALTRIYARLLAAIAIAAGAAGTVVLVALALGAAPLAPADWLRLTLVLLIGSIPFGLLGIGLGYAVPSRAALPVANLLYLVLSYLGGLWTGPNAVAHGWLSLGRFLPTRAWADLLWAVALGTRWSAAPIELLAGYTIAFAVFAVAAYHRAQIQRYGG